MSTEQLDTKNEITDDFLLNTSNNELLIQINFFSLDTEKKVWRVPANHSKHRMN